MQSDIDLLLDRRLQSSPEFSASDSAWDLLYHLTSLTDDVMESDFARLKKQAHDRTSMTAPHLFKMVTIAEEVDLICDYLLSIPVKKRDEVLHEAGTLAARFDKEDAAEQKAEHAEVVKSLRASFLPPPARPRRAAAAAAVAHLAAADAEGEAEGDEEWEGPRRVRRRRV